MSSEQPPFSRLTIYLAVILIILTATALRLYQLPTLPPGLNFDEAGNGMAAFDILRGTPKLWWRIGGGKEPLWPYLIALSTFLWGNIPLTLRLPAVFVGVLTVVAVYPLMHRLFRAVGQRQAQLVGLLTMLGLAVSSWHLHFSRLGFRAILLPLLSTLAFYFFWRCLVEPKRSGRNRFFGFLILSALFTAVAIYAYLAARLLPLVPMLFLVLYWLVAKIKQLVQRQSVSTPGLQKADAPTGKIRALLLLILKFLFLTILFLLPLIIYFVLNPADFMARSTTVSIFNPAWNNGDLVGTAWRTLTATLGTFLAVGGDANPLVNLPGQPGLPVLFALFFVFGLGVSLYYAVRPEVSTAEPGYSPQLFLLSWWLVMLWPAILAPEGAPHHLRLIGTLVPTYALVAIGLNTAANFMISVLANPLRGARFAARLVYGLLVAIYLAVGIQTYSNYFNRWPVSVDFTLPFDLYAVRLAADIAGSPPNTGYVLPMDIRAGAEARHYTLDYLLARQQPAAYVYLPVDERNIETILSQTARGKNQLRVVCWTADKHQAADEKELVTFLLTTNGQLLNRESFPAYDVETYVLAPSPDFILPTPNRSVGAVFDGLLRLEAAFLPPTTAPGDHLPVAITLAPLTPMEVDYKASLRLISPAGELVAQKDRILKHNFHQGTSLWPPEMVNEYYLLSIPADVPSGNYSVVVVIYHPDTLTPLIADGLAEVPLGQVRIE